MINDFLPAFLDRPESQTSGNPTKAKQMAEAPKPHRVNGPAIDKVKAKMHVLAVVLAGLEGRRFDWGMAEADNKTKALRGMGIELVTANGARKRGHVVKKGADPVGKRYFGAPIQRSADLYILDLQTRSAK
ncbi:MAG: hypothetical protein HY985_03285 [Magnetospirillum sp.]|nr:hypothetical protein [Magnetospirillum sp.]